MLSFRFLSVCLGLFAALGCAGRSADARFNSELGKLQREYKAGSDSAWQFPNVDRKAPEAQRRKQAEETLAAESKRVAGLAARLRKLDTPPKYQKQRDAVLQMFDGDAAIESEWAKAIHDANKEELAKLPGVLARSEFAASDSLIAAEEELHVDTTKAKEQLANSRATFKRLEAEQKKKADLDHKP